MLWLALVGCGHEALPPTHVTVDPDASVVRLVATGDVGRDTPLARDVAASMRAVCERDGCDAGLLLGDLLYPRGMERPDDPRMDARIRDRYAGIAPHWYLVHGNHDYAHGRNLERAKWQRAWADRTPGFHLPSPDWRLDLGPTTVLGVDTTRVFWDGIRSRGAWLDRTWADTEDRWRVVATHHPHRSNGPHGNAGAYEGWRGLPWVSGRALRTLFEDHVCGRADLVLSAHDHNLQWIAHCGTQWVVTGSGANPKAGVDRGNSPLFASDQGGFVWIELGDRMRVRFHDVQGRVLHDSTCCDKPSMRP